MMYNMFSNLVNVVLNYCLIYGKFGFPRWEIAGASLATIIGQTVAFLIALFVLLRGKTMSNLRFEKDSDLTLTRSRVL